MSHLSDAQETSGFNSKRCNTHINFAKFLLLKYSDTNVEIDADAEWKEFSEKHPSLL